MEKRTTYAIVAVIVAVIVIASAIEIIPRLSTANLVVSSSSSTEIAGQSTTFNATISGGSAAKVYFNFGDGTTGTATLSNGAYSVAHTYSSAGRYLVTANATVKGKDINNMKAILPITVTEPTPSQSVATQITEASIATTSQLYSSGSKVTLTGATLQPPSAANWTVGYYLWSFGDSSSQSNYAVMNVTGGDFIYSNVSHTYSSPGVYSVKLGVITFNDTGYSSTNYTQNGSTYSYYPMSDLNSILSTSSDYHNNTYGITIIVGKSGQTLKIENTTATASSSVITVAEVFPGGPFSFDPAIAPGTIDLEIVQNVYEPLVAYNGSSSQIIPIVASKVPSQANGLISSNGLNYTFPIRSGLTFSNGDTLTAYDVYYSMVRDLLFTQGTPGTNGFLIGSDLLPGGGFSPGALSYQNITHAVTYSNSSNSVTFHLLYADPAFLTYFASLWGTQIMDYKWLSQHGANITFSNSGFQYYTQFGNQNDYNSYVRYNTMGSGPYLVGSYVLGQSILLVPNPNYNPIPGIPGFDKKPTNDIQIEWVKSAENAVLMLQGGQADIVTQLPSYDFPAVNQLKSQGTVNVTTYPTEQISFFNYNFNVNLTMMHAFGSQYTMPADYLANQLVRNAFSASFNYSNYIDNILGNNQYNTNFGFRYTGMIPYGMPGYLNSSQIINLPTYDLSAATKDMQDSGQYNTKVDIPIIVPSGDLTDYAAASMWADALHSMDPNIQASPVYQPFSTIVGYAVPGTNPMPIYMMHWNPPWNYPTATLSFMYVSGSYGGYFPPADGISASYLTSIGQSSEANNWTQMQNLILKAGSTTNTTQALTYYDQAEQIAVNMSLYMYTYQITGIYIVSPLIHGMQMEENTITNSAQQMFYYYLTKD